MRQPPSDPRIDAAKRIAEKHDPDPEHAVQVAENAVELFDVTSKLHGLGEPERVLLCTAAEMHDVGWNTNPAQHHKGSRDLILGAPIDGFSPRETMMIACIARYHRKTLPKDDHKVYRDLDKKDRDMVCKLAALLRIADGLDRSHSRSVESISLKFDNKIAIISVKQRVDAPEDIEAAINKADLFEKVFKLKFVGPIS